MKAAQEKGSDGAEARLRKNDARLGCVIDAVIARIGRQRVMRSSASPFEAIARAIVYQSVSANAAAVIFSRLKKSIGTPLTPQRVLKHKPQTIAAAGLSRAKAAAIRNLAQWFVANRRLAGSFATMTDDDIVARLSSIRGIGVWTANVFLIFGLGRPDVMPAADLGIRRSVQLAYGLQDVATASEVHEAALAWQPHRSLASIYLWQAMKLGITPSNLKEAKNDHRPSPR